MEFVGRLRQGLQLQLEEFVGMHWLVVGWLQREVVGGWRLVLLLLVPRIDLCQLESKPEMLSIILQLLEKSVGILGSLDKHQGTPVEFVVGIHQEHQDIVGYLEEFVDIHQHL